MLTEIARQTDIMRTAPTDAETSHRSLTRTNRHYRSEGSMQPTLTESDLIRFWSKVNKTATCWLWTSTMFSAGYGCFSTRREGRHMALGAHRVCYLLTVGKIPEHLVVDHICRVRRCVNPQHLRLITSGQNVLIGISPSAINARKTHCNRGHGFTPENTYHRPNRVRECIACRNEAQRIRRKRHKVVLEEQGTR